MLYHGYANERHYHCKLHMVGMRGRRGKKSRTGLAVISGLAAKGLGKGLEVSGPVLVHCHFSFPLSF